MKIKCEIKTTSLDGCIAGVRVPALNVNGCETVNNQMRAWFNRPLPAGTDPLSPCALAVAADDLRRSDVSGRYVSLELEEGAANDAQALLAALRERQEVNGFMQPLFAYVHNPTIYLITLLGERLERVALFVEKTTNDEGASAETARIISNEEIENAEYYKSTFEKLIKSAAPDDAIEKAKTLFWDAIKAAMNSPEIMLELLKRTGMYDNAFMQLETTKAKRAELDEYMRVKAEPAKSKKRGA